MISFWFINVDLVSNFLLQRSDFTAEELALMAAIAAIDAREEWLNHELDDMFSDVETPPESEDEGAFEEAVEEDPPVCFNGIEPGSPAHEMLLRMLNVNWRPESGNRLDQLYSYQSTQRKAKRKLHLVLGELRRCAFNTIFVDPEFHYQIVRVRDQYPSTAGRPGLDELIGNILKLFTFI